VPFLPSTGVAYVFYPENPVYPAKNPMASIFTKNIRQD
jgi:hypothetical protein